MRLFRASILIVVVLAIPLVVWRWRVLTEPGFEGRGVREWIAQLPYDQGNSDTRRAMDHFGERAVPYLIDATERRGEWWRGWRGKIPRKYVSQVINLQEVEDVGKAALRQLEELVREEVERNELLLDPHYPVADQLVVTWKRQLRAEFSGELLSAIGNLGPKATNLAPELKVIWQRTNPAGDHWTTLTRLVAEMRDESLTRAFLYWANRSEWVNVRLTQTSAEDVKRWAIYALGRNGHVTEEVKETMRMGLDSTNENTVAVTLLACAQLGVCKEEALARIEEKQTTAPWQLSWGVEYSNWVAPILRWGLDTNSVAARERIRANLSPQTRAAVRRGTAELLGKRVPAAIPFVPDLLSMAREPDPDVRLAAVSALRAIDAEGLRNALPTLPIMVKLRATRAGVTKEF